MPYVHYKGAKWHIKDHYAKILSSLAYQNSHLEVTRDRHVHPALCIALFAYFFAPTSTKVTLSSSPHAATVKKQQHPLLPRYHNTPKSKMVSTAFITGAALPTLRQTRPAISRRTTTPHMSLRRNLARIAATAPISIATIAHAEGTGEGLGIDNPLLYLPLVLVPAVFLVFFLQFDGQQNKEDFFGAYDERRE